MAVHFDLGEVDLNNSHIGGSLTFGAGKFHSSAAALEYGSLRAAVDISGATVNGSVGMCCSFEAQGMVVLQTEPWARNSQFMAGHFNNPGGVALNALAARIGGDVFLSELNLGTIRRLIFEATVGSSPLLQHISQKFTCAKAEG